MAARIITCMTAAGEATIGRSMSRQILRMISTRRMVRSCYSIPHIPPRMPESLIVERL